MNVFLVIWKSSNYLSVVINNLVPPVDKVMWTETDRWFCYVLIFCIWKIQSKQSKRIIIFTSANNLSRSQEIAAYRGSLNSVNRFFKSTWFPLCAVVLAVVARAAAKSKPRTVHEVKLAGITASP